MFLFQCLLGIVLVLLLPIAVARLVGRLVHGHSALQGRELAPSRMEVHSRLWGLQYDRPGLPNGGYPTRGRGPGQNVVRHRGYVAITRGATALAVPPVSLRILPVHGPTISGAVHA